MILKIQYNKKQRRVEFNLERISKYYGLVFSILSPFTLCKIYELIKPFLGK